MRILLLTNHLNPGGVSAYCLLLARYFKESPHQVLIASGGGRWESAAAEHGIPHFKVPLHTSSEANPKLWAAFARLSGIVRRERIDLVHDQTRVTQVIGAALAWRFGLPRVSTCHGFFKTRFFRRIFPLWGDRVIAVSDAVRGHLIHDWGLKDAQIRVVTHGMEFAPVARQNGTAAAARKEWGIPAQALLMGALGRLSPVKGFDVLIRALSLIKNEAPPIYLVIAGDGDERARLESAVREESLEGRVKFIPSIDETAPFLKAVDIFCAPSRQEGFGLSILEAMGAGAPVIASRIGGIPGMVRHEDTGLLVEPENPEELSRAILRLAGDEALRHRLSETAGRLVRDRYSAEEMTRKTRAVYEELVPS